MTNEQLAALAQDPNNKELVPVLWDKVKNLLYMKANSAYRQYKSIFTQCGIELSDIRQSCYTVFLEALKGYKPDSGMQFNSFLNYPFKTMIQELTHTRTSRKEPLNDAVSLDIPLQDKDGETVTTQLDLLPDESANVECDVLDTLEQEEERKAVRDAVAALPELHRDVIEALYFRNETQKDIAACMGCSRHRINYIHHEALRKLRYSPILCRMYREQELHERWKQIQRFEDRPEYFDMLQQLRERQEQERVYNL